jgi:hypothetical protein
MTRWIAEEHVIWAFPDGTRKEGRIAIGEPELAPGGETNCAYALDGLEYVAGPIKGGGALQALCIALRFVGWKLYAFQAAGGRVLDEEGEEAGIESILGPLLSARITKDSG